MADQPLPADVPLTLYRGDTRVWTDTIEQNTGTADAPVWAPYDLTGSTFLAEIRAGIETAAGGLVADRTGTLKATLDVTSDAPATGVVVFTLSSTEADGLDVTPCFWDFQITDGTGFRRTHLAGKVKVLGDVSND